MIRRILTQPRSVGGQLKANFLDILFDPEAFYDRLSPYYIRYEFLFVAAIALVGAIGMFYTVEQILTEFTTDFRFGFDANEDNPPMPQDTARHFWGRIGRPPIEIFLLWLYYTTAFHVGSWFYTDRGSYYHMLKSTAWGFLPLFFGTVVYYAALPVTFWLIELETDLPGRVSANHDYLMNQAFTEPLVIVATLVYLVLLVWCGRIWIYAVSSVRGITPREAMPVVGLAVFAHAAYFTWEFFQIFTFG